MKTWNILKPKTPKSSIASAPIFNAARLLHHFWRTGGLALHRWQSIFWLPPFHQMSDPTAMKDMGMAVSRIHDAILRQERILVFGDYDVDGITAAVLITEFLTAAGARVTYYIPHRETEGYGLKPSHISNPGIVNNIDLIITADCGSSSHEAVDSANRAGIDVIITDHHMISHSIPEAVAVVNPRRSDCPSGLKI